jgi:hypothetical protein
MRQEPCAGPILSNGLIRCKERGLWTRSNKMDVKSMAEVNLYDFMDPPNKLQELYKAQQHSLK